MAGVRLPEARREQGPIRLLGLILAGSAVAIAALVAVVLLIGTGGGGASPGISSSTTTVVAPRKEPTHKPTAHLRWIIAGEDLAALRTDNAGLARRFFDNPSTFVVGSRGTPDQVPKGYRSISILSYASLGSFVSDVHSGSVDPGIAGVLYDPEHWSRTPAQERSEPVAAMRRFTGFARDWGYGALLSPGRDLALGVDSPCRKNLHELLDQAFLRCDPMAAAGGAEAFVAQSAPEELRPGPMAALIDATHRRLSAAGGSAALFATLSAAPPGVEEEVWPADLLGAAELAIRHGADGLMLNFAAEEVDLVASFLRDLERAGPIAGIAVSRPEGT